MITLKKEKPIFIIYSNWDVLIYFLNFIYLILCLVSIINLWTDNKKYNLFILMAGISVYIFGFSFSIWLSQNWKVLKTEKVIFWKNHIEFVNEYNLKYIDIKEFTQKIIKQGKHLILDYSIDGKYIGNEFEDLEYLKYFLSRNEPSKHIRYYKIQTNDTFFDSEEVITEV